MKFPSIFGKPRLVFAPQYITSTLLEAGDFSSHPVSLRHIVTLSLPSFQGIPVVK
jgi:hypothetical protein